MKNKKLPFRFLNNCFAVSWCRALLLLCTGCSSQAFAQSNILSPAEKEIVSSISVDKIKEVTTNLTAPEMQGRGTAQAGGVKAAQYLAEEFKRAGLKPLGDSGTFLQKVSLQGFRVSPESTMLINEKPLEYLKDFLFVPAYLTHVLHPPVTNVAGEMVYAGYGLSADHPKRDDLKGIDVKGKIVLLLDGMPDDATMEEWSSVHIMTKVEKLGRLGAAGVVVIYETPAFSAGRIDLATRRSAMLKNVPRPYPTKLPALVFITSAVAKQIFAKNGVDFSGVLEKTQKDEFVSRNLNQKMSLSMRLDFEQPSTGGFNVVGFLEGSDPVLKKEAVVYTAHYDAFGLEKDGRVFPGAADNALDVGNIIAIAGAMKNSATRSKRSIVFVSTTGEEQWMLGAFNWVAHPGWPLDKIAANLNLDGIATETWGELKIFYAIGASQSNFGPLLNETAESLGRKLEFDSLTPTGLFQRSDQFEFAKRGIPTIYAIGYPDEPENLGVRLGQVLDDEIHAPLDQIKPDWNWSGPLTHAKFYAVLGLRIANENALPVWKDNSAFNFPRGGYMFGAVRR